LGPKTHFRVGRHEINYFGLQILLPIQIQLLENPKKPKIYSPNCIVTKMLFFTGYDVSSLKSKYLLKGFSINWGPPNFSFFENLDKQESAMFRFGSKTAKSKISRKLVKKPTAQTSSKFRPRPIKKFSCDADSKKVNLP
jgi:hypothetical protein